MEKPVDVEYVAGTIKSPQHTKLTQAAFTETDKVHFPDGRLTNIPPWAEVTYDGASLLGACRTIHGAEVSGGNFNYLHATNSNLYVLRNSTLSNITPLRTTSTTLGNNPIATTNGQAVITVTHTAHGLVTGNRIKISGATGPINTVPASEINKEHIVTVVNANSYRVNVTTAATATGSGGGASVLAYKQIASQGVNQILPTGFGAGLFGANVFGYNQQSQTGASIYPRIWSFDDFGQDVIMCPGDTAAGDGRKIYIWDYNINTAPTVLTNAPTDCNFVLTVKNCVVALCGNRVDISSIGDATRWEPNASIDPGTTAYSKTLQRLSRLVCGIRLGEKSALLFSDNEVLILRYVGGTELWDISDAPGGNNDGIIGPNACCEMNGTVYWRGRQNMFRFSGAFVEIVDNPQNGDWITQNINTAQMSKSFMAVDHVNGQIVMHFPAGADNEPNDYVIYNTKGHFTLGKMSRTASMKRVIGGRLLMANSTSETLAGDIFTHYLKDTNIAVEWSAVTAEAYAGDGQRRFEIKQFWPDSNQIGTTNIQYRTRDYARGDQYNSQVYSVEQGTEYQTVVAAGRIRSIAFNGTGQFSMGAWKETVRMLGK